MRKAHVRRYMMIPAAVLAALGLVLWTGCGKDLMSPDDQPPSGSTITNPVDATSLNKSVINVRGRAEVGATIDVFVNDDLKGTGGASPAVPNDGLGGRYTVESVDLGLEGVKVLRARITDLYGNVATSLETPVITITLDQTAPPVALEGVEGATWVDTLGFWGVGFWETGLPVIIVSGSTDSTAAGARLRVGLNEHAASELVADPGSSAVNFTIDVPSPPLAGGHADTLITYFLEAFDAAGNVTAEPLLVHWEVEGRELELSHDDGIYNSFDHTVSGTAGDEIAVRFQAPTWANYVTKFIFYSANDQQDNPIDPQLPTTWPFTAWVWHCNLSDMPGNKGNDGYMPFTEPYSYPEDAWVEITFPTAEDISDNAHYPDKKFFVGLEWEHRLSPHIYEDHSDPLDYCSFLKIYFANVWDLRTQADTMIRAVVSDVPTLGEGREAVLIPVRVKRQGPRALSAGDR
ncbi:MAG: hypothetical protein ABIE42_08055 [Candidatus Eisenbacteria bacterium]